MTMLTTITRAIQSLAASPEFALGVQAGTDITLRTEVAPLDIPQIRHWAPGADPLDARSYHGRHVADAWSDDPDRTTRRGGVA